MAIKKPIVLVNGQWQQLQAGDSIAQVEYISQTNGEASVALVCGMPVYSSAADTVKRAKADAGGTVPVIFLTVDTSIAAASSGNFIANGILSLTTAQWDAIAGTSGGLTFDTAYYLSNATAGNLTATAPTTGYSQQIGVAISTTELNVSIQRPIQL